MQQSSKNIKDLLRITLLLQKSNSISVKYVPKKAPKSHFPVISTLLNVWISLSTQVRGKLESLHPVIVLLNQS